MGKGRFDRQRRRDGVFDGQCCDEDMLEAGMQGRHVSRVVRNAISLVSQRAPRLQ